MSQIHMTQAGVQIEARRELGKLLRPLIQKIIRSVRSRYSTDNAPAAMQPQQRRTPVQRLRLVFVAIVSFFAK